jgi:hypothetical protein
MGDDQFNSIENLLGHLMSCGNDLTLLTLKGHLVLESFLDTILARLLRISSLPIYPEHGALEFVQKLTLVKMFVVQNYESGPNSDLFLVIRKLNTVRNELAHNLRKPEEIQKQVKALLDCHHSKERKKPVRAADLSEPLRGCLVKLWQFLFRVRKHLFDMEIERLARESKRGV